MVTMDAGRNRMYASLESEGLWRVEKVTEHTYKP